MEGVPSHPISARYYVWFRVGGCALCNGGGIGSALRLYKAPGLWVDSRASGC